MRACLFVALVAGCLAAGSTAFAQASREQLAVMGPRARARQQQNRPVRAAAQDDDDSNDDVEMAASGMTTPTVTQWHGREIANMNRDTCLAKLGEIGVDYSEVDADDANGVEIPIRLQSPIDGIEIATRAQSSVHAILDCRVALAIHQWSDVLRAKGVVRIEHYSIYRPNARVAGTHRASAHAAALAIDAAIFVRADGTRVDVLNEWGDRTHHADPCVNNHGDESENAEFLRLVVCSAVARDLFQVVITPHHDAAHQNHVHMELRPQVSWSYIH